MAESKLANPSIPPGGEFGGISHAAVPARRFSAIVAEDSTPSAPRNVRRARCELRAGTRPRCEWRAGIVAEVKLADRADGAGDRVVVPPTRTPTMTKTKPRPSVKMLRRRGMAETQFGDDRAWFGISFPTDFGRTRQGG